MNLWINENGDGITTALHCHPLSKSGEFDLNGRQDSGRWLFF